MSVQLIIKSAAQIVDDFKLDCELSWTVGQVKDQISVLYPTKPKREQQKLIYGGKLLPDHLALKSVINQMQEIHVLHLVCPFPPASNAKQNETKETPVTPSATFTVPPTNPVYPQMSQVFTSPNITSDTPTVGSIPVFNPGADMVHQYLAMQQMYTQFMAQYLSQYNGSTPLGIPYGPITGTVPPVQPPTNPAPRQNAAANVPQRPAEDDEHDYVDYLYIFSRAIVLFAILYHYSSFIRIFAVVVMFLIMSVYVKFSRQQNQLEAEQRARETNEAPASSQLPSDSQDMGTEQNVPESSAVTDPSPTETPSRIRSFTSGVSVVLALVSSFFSSLIPTEPVPVNIN